MLNRDALLFSPTRDGVPSSDDHFTADDLLGAQEALEAEARDTLPYRFDQCTYDLGYIKQPLFACRTCLGDRAVCHACSISCHTSHELVELFNRRAYRCDCGTAAMGAGSCCSISGRDDAEPNSLNRIDDNFRGIFCYCGRPYDPHTETDDMLQCLVCEDWLHAACVGLPHSDDDDDPTKPLCQDDFDQLVCWRCVQGSQDVRRVMTRYAGVEGTGVLLLAPEATVFGRVRSSDTDDDDEGTVKGDDEGEAVEASAETTTEPQSEGKRKAADDAAEEPAAKRVKAAGTAATAGPSASGATEDGDAVPTGKAPDAQDPASCRAPPVVPADASPLVKLERGGARPNVYLEEGFMDRWCRCREVSAVHARLPRLTADPKLSQCLGMFTKLPFLLEEEEVFEPPEDPDARSSPSALRSEPCSH